MSHHFSRYVVQAEHEVTVVLDQIGLGVGPDLIKVDRGLLEAAHQVAAIVWNRDPDSYVEVYSSGVGLAMAGLLRAHGLNVINAYVWKDAAEAEVE